MPIKLYGCITLNYCENEFCMLSRLTCRVNGVNKFCILIYSQRAIGMFNGGCTMYK